MNRAVKLLLVFVFLTASLIMAAKPVSAAAPVENSWTTKAPMHVARSSMGVAVVNGKIYAIGGTAGNAVSTNEEYNPTTDTWTFKTPMPIPMSLFATAVYQNKIYCIGEGTNEVYDPATDTWEMKTPMPTPRYELQANVANGKIYLIGGFPYPNGSFVNEVYDPATDSWTTKTPIPTAVAGYVSAIIDGKIYIIDSGANQIYDTVTDSWTQGASPPHSTSTPWGAAATTDVNAPKRIYIFSGKSVEIYDTEADNWVFGSDLPTNRDTFGVAVFNDMFYVIGGYTQTYSDFPDDWIYGPKQTWYATNEQYTPFGYGTVPPAIAVVSPENENYTSGNVSLAFTVNKQAVWMGYSLDGQDNVTMSGNVTLSGLSTGLHNVTVYAKDEFDNIGASETIIFNVPESFPIAVVVAASVATIAVVGVGLMVYFKKRKH
jgi:N-acetylneuraminic acid mutarotase